MTDNYKCDFIFRPKFMKKSTKIFVADVIISVEPVNSEMKRDRFNHLTMQALIRNRSQVLQPQAIRIERQSRENMRAR